VTRVLLEKTGARNIALALSSLAAFALFASASGAAGKPGEEEGKKAFDDVARVLQSPRCVNCHPNGDAPMVGDKHARHPMEVKRGLEKLGMACNSCHRETVTSIVDTPGTPPAAAHWGLAPPSQIFEGRTHRELCNQLRDPKSNGGKTAAALVEHVSGDGLVLHGWNPGGKRTLPPLSHDEFVAKFQTWVEAGMPCP
jgi:hypothetical protein